MEHFAKAIVEGLQAGGNDGAGRQQLQRNPSC